MTDRRVSSSKNNSLGPGETVLESNDFILFKESQGNTTNNVEYVFQCQNCNSILGDTLNYVCSNKKMEMVVLKRASNVVKGNHIYTSKLGDDVGSAYLLLNCGGCEV